MHIQARRIEVETALLTIRTDTGDEGYCFSPPQIVREHVLDKFVRKSLTGQIRSCASRSGRTSLTGNAEAPDSSPTARWRWSNRRCGISPDALCNSPSTS